jgi:HD domain
VSTGWYDEGRRSRSATPFTAAVALSVVAAVTMTATKGVDQPGLAIAFIAFISIGELLRISLPGNRDTAPLGAAAAVAYALLPAFNGTRLEYSVPQTVTIVAVGVLLGALPRAVAGRPVLLEDLARRVVVAAVLAGLFRPLIIRADIFDPEHPDWQLAATMTAAALIAGGVDVAIAAAIRAAANHAPYRTSFADEFRAFVGIGTAITATGVLIALATPLMGLWAIPVFAAPLVLTQFSFRRYATIRVTYLQTIRALSRVTEVGGQTETGHSRRVSRLAVSIGRELGLPERDLLDLEYAALMHDIGQLSLATPIPGGATTMVSRDDQRRIAELGAGVIRQAGVLERVATIVERQADSYRPAGAEDRELPLESRIIRTVNVYDDLVGASLEFDRKQQAVERLQLSTTRDHDPRVVDVLSRIVERQAVYAY